MNLTTTIILNNSPYLRQTTNEGSFSVSFKIDNKFSKIVSNIDKKDEKKKLKNIKLLVHPNSNIK